MRSFRVLFNGKNAAAICFGLLKKKKKKEKKNNLMEVKTARLEFTYTSSEKEKGFGLRKRPMIALSYSITVAT